MSTPAISVRDLTHTYQARYSDARSIHTDFSGGMIRDIPSYMLPDNAVYDAADWLCDYVGKIRKRGGTTSPSSSNRTATFENLLSFRSNGLDGVTGLFGSTGKSTGVVYTIDPTTGAATSMGALGANPSVACRPFQHGNYGVFPFAPAAQANGAGNGCAFVGGGTAAGFAVTAATVVAGNNRITGIAPTSLVAGHLGSIISLVSSTTNAYIGRIVEVTSSSAVRVDPTPNFSFTAIASSSVFSLMTPDAWAVKMVGGRYGVSFQNRIVLLHTVVAQSATTVNGINPESNRLRWSILPTETTPQISWAGVTTYDGDNFLYAGSFLGDNTTALYNYQDIPNLGGATGLATVGDGQLLIFGPRKMFRFSGQLATETVLNNSFSYSIDQVSNNVGIPKATTLGSDDPSKSIQYTQGGLVFAGNQNIFEYDGSSLKPLLQGRNATYYRARLRNGDLIYGSAYSLSQNHYYLSMSGTDGGLLINLDTNAMTRMTGPTTQLFDAVPDPSNATKLWGARWWDTTGAAPTMTKGQLIQIDPIWAPAQANSSDADGTAVLPSLQTKSWTGGELAPNKRPMDVQLSYGLVGTGSPTATLSIGTALDTSQAAYATVSASVPNTVATTTATFGARTLPLVSEGPAVEFKFVQNAASATTEIYGFDIGLETDPIL